MGWVDGLVQTKEMSEKVDTVFQKSAFILCNTSSARTLRLFAERYRNGKSFETLLGFSPELKENLGYHINPQDGAGVRKTASSTTLSRTHTLFVLLFDKDILSLVEIV